jgi:hypothetical protein
MKAERGAFDGFILGPGADRANLAKLEATKRPDIAAADCPRRHLTAAAWGGGWS